MSSCKAGGLINQSLNELNSDDDGRIADDKLEKIIKAINGKDKETLKSMFSEQALNEAEDIDGRMDYLFDFINETVESWEKVVHGATTESIESGNRIKKSSSWYYMDTNKQKYLIFFLECTINTKCPENVGLYMLQVIRAEDKDEQFDGGGPVTRCAGIYTKRVIYERFKPIYWLNQ